MEDFNNRNNFENFLRDSIEDFKMLPSRKIWHSIYNNMHPDRKWPSIAVCLLILVSILYLGISNNNSLSNAARSAKEQNITLLSKKSFQNTIEKKLPNNTEKAGEVQQVDPAYAGIMLTNAGLAMNNELLNADAVETNRTTLSLNNSENEISPSTLSQLDNLAITKPSYAAENVTGSIAAISSVENRKVISTTANTKSSLVFSEADLSQLSKTTSAVTDDSATVAELMDDNKNSIAINTIKAANASPSKEATKSTENSILKESKKENKTLIDINVSALENRLAAKQAFMQKFKENASISYYITPSIGFRNLHTVRDIKNYNAAYSSFAANNTTPNSNALSRDEKALNVEVGASMNYKITKSVRLKTGLQVNYTNYISKVNDLGHPIQTSLAVSNQQDVYRSSQYTTAEGSTHLNRSTLQVAIPIGTDVKIIGNDKIKWYIGASFQPTYVISGSGYVMSIDGKNYISEKPLLRRLNFNTALESYLSFKTSNGIVFNVGPQVRYQILSSYKKNYNYSEKLYNLGVKIGVTTSF